MTIIYGKPADFTVRTNFDELDGFHIECFSVVRYSDLYNFLDADICDVLNKTGQINDKAISSRDLFDAVSTKYQVQFIVINKDSSFFVKILPV